MESRLVRLGWRYRRVQLVGLSHFLLNYIHTVPHGQL